MMSWVEGLRDLKETALDRVADYWHDLAPGFTMNQNGRNNLQMWTRKFNVEELCNAMDIAAEQYLRFKEDGNVTSESWKEAFAKIPGICRVNRASEDEPDLKDLFYIRGIVRKRLDGRHYKDYEALDMLKAAHSWDVPLDELRTIAKRVTSWTQFHDAIIDAIDEQKELQGIEPDA